MTIELPKGQPITHDLDEIEKVINTQFPCKVQDRGYGHHKQGHRGIAIIVGKKENPAYNPTSPYKEMRNIPKEAPDVRMIYMPGDADENWLVNQVQNIKGSLPENQDLEFKKETLEKMQEDDYSGVLPKVTAPKSVTQKQHDENLKGEEVKDEMMDLMTTMVKNQEGMKKDQEGMIKKVESLTERMDEIDETEKTKPKKTKSQTAKKQSVKKTTKS